jgi:hypothetical protein
MPKLTKSYQESLLQALQNPQEAAEYLTAALEEEDSAAKKTEGSYRHTRLYPK